MAYSRKGHMFSVIKKRHKSPVKAEVILEIKGSIRKRYKRVLFSYKIYKRAPLILSYPHVLRQHPEVGCSIKLE